MRCVAFCFRFCVFTGRGARPTPFGDPIFRCTTKDRGERRAKGLRPLESPGVNSDRKPDVLCACVFAMVRVTRLSRLRRSAYPLASACCGCPVRTKDLRNHPTSDHKSGRLFYKCYEFAAVGAVQLSPWKQCACHTPRTGLNRVNCIWANT